MATLKTLPVYFAMCGLPHEVSEEMQERFNNLKPSIESRNRGGLTIDCNFYLEDIPIDENYEYKEYKAIYTTQEICETEDFKNIVSPHAKEVLVISPKEEVE